MFETEAGKTVWQLVMSNLSLTVIILLFILSGLFKIAKKEIDPLGWVVSHIGKALTKVVQKDVADLKTDTTEQFNKIKTDRAQKIEELKRDYNEKITTLKTDLDNFETKTTTSIDELKSGTTANCEEMKKRLDDMEKSNDLQTIRQIRAHVLDFANSCMNKRKHTKLEFENIIAENAQYEVLCAKHEVKNNVYKEDYEFIMKIYHQCREDNSFLKDAEA